MIDDRVVEIIESAHTDANLISIVDLMEAAAHMERDKESFNRSDWDMIRNLIVIKERGQR